MQYLVNYTFNRLKNQLVTISSSLTLKIARKRLYFNNFKGRLVHFNGTVVITIYVKLIFNLFD
jgi:hypothetical protein